MVGLRTFGSLLSALLPLVAGCLGGDLEPDEGFPCHQDVECRSGLVCQYDRCRRPCDRDRDCSDEGACVASLLLDTTYDYLNRVCTHPSETGCLSDGECPDYLLCGPEGRCRERCDEELLPCGEGWRCHPESGVCLEDP